MEILYSYPKKNNISNLPKNLQVTDKFYKKKNPLYDEKIENIVDTFDEISKYWISNDFKSKHLFIQNSLCFKIPW